MSASTIPAMPVKQSKSIKGKLIGAIALLVVAAIVAVGSGANFTAHTANPGNMVTEGAFSMSNDQDGQALFAPQTNWDPGEQVSGQVAIGNAGTETGNFTVTGIPEAGNDDEFSKNVFVQVVDRAGSFDSNTLSQGGIGYSGSLYNFINGCQGLTDGDPNSPGMQSVEKMPNDPGQQSCIVNTAYNGSAWDLHNWDSGQTHYYTFRLINSAPDGDGNSALVRLFQGKTAKFAIKWDATSTA